MKKVIIFFVLILFQLSSHAYSEDIELNDQEKYYYSQWYSASEMEDPNFMTPNSMGTLGWYHFSGTEGFQVNNERAIGWIKKGIKFKDAQSAYNLGLFYYVGLAGLEQNFSKAHEYWILSSELWGDSGYHTTGLLEEINEYVPDPDKKFANLRDLYMNYIIIPTEKKLAQLKNLVDLSGIQDEKITVETFIKNEKITCSERHGGRYTQFHILKKLSDGNFLIQYFQGDPSSPDTFGTAEEDKLDVINFAVFTNERFEWFTIGDEFFGLPPSITYFSVYAEDNNKKLIFQRIDGDITKPEFKKLNRSLSKANKYKKSDIGGTKHIEFAYLFHNDATAVLRSARIDKNYKFTCE